MQQTNTTSHVSMKDLRWKCDLVCVVQNGASPDLVLPSVGSRKEVACLDARHLWDFAYLWNAGGRMRWEWILIFKDFSIPMYLS